MLSLSPIAVESYLKNKHKNDKLYLQSIQIDLTNRCNARCPFCLQGNHEYTKDELTLNEIRRVLLDAKKLGVYNIGFDGGEAFLREDFHEILEYASSLGFSISIATNGHLIKDSDIDLFKRISLSKVSVSFHSFDKFHYNQLFGVNGNEYEHSLEMMRKMKEQGIHVGIAITITKLNLHDIPDIIANIEQLGIAYNDIGFNHLIPGKSPIEDLALTSTQKADLARYLSKRGIFTCLRNKFLCNAGRTAIHIGFNGNVYACPLLDVVAGNIRQDTLKDIWINSDFLKMLRSLKENQFTECMSCDSKDSCQMCLKCNLVYNNDMFIPYKATCTYMKAAKEN